MKAKRIVMAVAVLVLVLAMACALVSCDFFGGGGSENKDTTYEVTLECDSSEGSVSGGGKFKQGDSVTIIATANEGYFFAGWYDCDTKVADQAEWTFSMGEKAISYTAKFSVNSYTVNLDCDLLKGNVAGGGDYEYGSSVTITATPNTGYSFIGWYDGDKVISTNAEYTFTMGDDNIAWTAKFGINKYIVDLDCVTEQGTVTGSGEYDYGSSVTITATEKVGYVFDAWYDGNKKLSEQANYTFTMVAKNVTYTAKYTTDSNYEKLKLTLLDDGTYKITGVKDSSIKNIKIPNYVSIIGNRAFKGCSSLTSVTIPNSVTSIDDYAFNGCNKISEVKYNGTIEQWLNISGLDNLMDKGSNKKLYIGGNELTELVIPDGITSIGLSAFRNCSSLTSVTIGNSVTNIGSYAFEDCSNISEVKYNGTIEQWCAISGLGNLMDNGSNKKLYIGDNEIAGDLVIPNSVTSIGSSAFRGFSGLTSITIPNSVTSIGYNAFAYCSNISEVKYNGTIEQWCAISGLGNLMDNGSNKKLYIGDNDITGDLVIPDSITNIGSYAFYGCSSLTSVTIGNSVTSIDSYAFRGCSSLTSVTIGNSVTSIGNWAFSGCNNISKVKYNGTIEQWLAISGLDNLMYYGSKKKLYIGGNELTKLVIPNSVTSIGDHAFYNCSSLTSVIIPDSVTSIGDWAFYNCSRLASVTIPDSVTSIGYSAFYGCSSLTSVTIGNRVTSIGSNAFYGCSALINVTIPDSVTSISINAFGHCSSLISVTIPNSVTNIGDDAFSGCISLTSVTIGNGVTSIDWGAFKYCYALAEVYNLSSLNITKGSEDNGHVAFYARDVFNSLSEPSKLTEKDGMILHTDGNNVTLVRYIGDATSVIIPDSVTSIGDHAFYDCVVSLA